MNQLGVLCLVVGLASPAWAEAPPDAGLWPERSGAILEGRSCGAAGELVTPRSFARERDSARWSSPDFWGCGCPKGNPYLWTLVYEPRTIPLVVRICRKASVVGCDTRCVSGFDLGEALRAAGAKDVTLVTK